MDKNRFLVRLRKREKNKHTEVYIDFDLYKQKNFIPLMPKGSTFDEIQTGQKLSRI